MKEDTQIYCTLCEFLTPIDVEIGNSEKNGYWEKVGTTTAHECSKHKQKIFACSSNVYIPCIECNGKDFEMYTSGPTRLKPNSAILSKIQ